MAPIVIFPKDKVADRAFLSRVEEKSFWSLQIDGVLASGEEIALYTMGIDEDDAVTGKDATTVPLTDDNGDAVVLTSETPNPMGFYRPARVVAVKSSGLTNDVGLMLLVAGTGV